MGITKILIIKLGYSETLDTEIGRVPSLGDVLRTTPLLSALRERFPEARVTWLVSEEAAPLLHGNPLLDRILVWDSFVGFQLMREKFDVLVNLEKIPGICALADMIDAWTKYGFRFDTSAGTYQAYERGQGFLSYIQGKQNGQAAQRSWQQLLLEMLGLEWKGQEYVLGYRPRGEVAADVGLNWQVGSKWPNKAMDRSRWEELARRLEDAGLTVSWQRGLKDLWEYMDWIHSCRLVVSSDSLGVHIALAMGKKILVLAGPTDPSEICLYGRGRVIQPPPLCPRMPCYHPGCDSGLHCMERLDLEAVARTAQELLQTPSTEASHG